MDIRFNTVMSRRRWLQRAASVAGLALLTRSLSACGGAQGASTGGDATKLALSCDGEKLLFDKTTLSAPAGKPVELTFANRSNHHQHNWLLVNGDDETAMAVYEAAVAAGVKNDWLPPAGPQIITHTPLLDAGKSFTLAFQAPAKAGQYTYLCTFPGHFLAGMKGVLTIT